MSFLLVGSPFLGPDHGHLSHGTTPGIRQHLPLGVGHVPALAAHEGPVHSDWPVVRLRHPSLADSVEHEPCGGLRDLQIPVQLQAGDRL